MTITQLATEIKHVLEDIERCKWDIKHAETESNLMHFTYFMGDNKIAEEHKEEYQNQLDIIESHKERLNRLEIAHKHLIGRLDQITKEK